MTQKTAKTGEIVIIADDGTFILGAGSPVNEATGKSISPSHVALREEAVVNGKTTKDLKFKSLSAIASFVRGAQINGKKYFAEIYAEMGGTETTTASTATASKAQEEATATPAHVDVASLSEAQIAKIQTENNAIAQRFVNLCKGFAYDADPRTINTLKYGDGKPDEHVIKCMELLDLDPNLIEDAKKQFKNAEAKQIFADIKNAVSLTGKINKRLEIFYGPAGTGKTTQAIAENPGAVRIVASAGADPDDLFTRIDPETKKWVLTDIAEAMEAGKPIIIDEINLYNSVVLQRLQGIADNTEVLKDRGIEIHIREGFKIVGTMNLRTNLSVSPLPDPLLSRASRIEKFDNPFLGWVF